MTDSVDCVVIGAGVVGLAVAREMSAAGLETILLESESRIGTSTSSRNSEVIHAGIYYPPGSAKARLCVEGKQLLYAYCRERGLEFDNCGKLIVATSDDQLPRLQGIIDNARASGVDDLEMLDRDRAQDMEPDIECVAALLSPSTGIVDSHSLMLSLQGDAEQSGTMLAFVSPVVGGECRKDGVVLRVGGDSEMELQARFVVNSAGLGAQSIAAAIRGLPADSIPPLYLAKGNYYSLNGRSPFSRLVYPVPEAGGLGVHLTLDLGGRARFGPDVEWVDAIDYEVDPGRADVFYEQIRKYWPALPDGALAPDYAGIRAKLKPPGEGAHDFVIQGADAHGIAGLVNLYGIESPGLTAALAIARRVRSECLREGF